MQRQPTLLSSCARAATAAEARFRISPPEFARRSSRVIALDERAAELARSLAGRPWRGGRFLEFGELRPASGGLADAVLADAVLLGADGTPTLLSAELDGTDLAVMLATPGARAEAASAVGDACAARWITSVGLVVGAPGEAQDVVAALRPNAMVLVSLRSSQDVAEILSALRI
jgi:hypothetical protein